jgi:hypothetical protein
MIRSHWEPSVPVSRLVITYWFENIPSTRKPTDTVQLVDGMRGLPGRLRAGVDLLVVEFVLPVLDHSEVG